MKKYYLLFLLFSFSSYSQIGGEDEVYLNSDIINPKFNGGGIEKFYEFVNKNFNLSLVSKSGTMITAFTVDENGDVKKIKVTQMIDIESATEIIRVLKLSPKWQPAVKNGKPISIEIKLPLDLKVSEPKETTNSTVKEDFSSQSTIIEGKRDELVIPANILEVQPEYPGGIKEFYAFIIKNFVPPDQPGLKGKVVLSFVVGADGSLGNFLILKDVGYGSGEEAVRVFKLMPLWKPGMQKGIPVRCQYTIPITIYTPK